MVLENLKTFDKTKFDAIRIETNEPKKETAIDCKNKILLPGLIDVHVHFRVPGYSYKEDWESGSKAAVAGGITTVLDMPNNKPPTSTAKRLEIKRAIAQKESACNFGLLFAVGLNNLKEIEKAKNFSAIKVFMGSGTSKLVVNNKSQLCKIFKVSKKIGKPVAVHAEDESTLQHNIKKAKEKGWNSATRHSRIRSKEVESLAVENALKAQKKQGNRLHFVHISTKESLELIKEAKNEKRPISCEVTPFHLFLDETSLEKLGNFGKINPPIRDKQNQKALWKAINKGIVDCIATDHAPHTISEKNEGYWNAPSGMPGLETMLPLLLDAVNKERLSLKKLVKLCHTSPAKIFGIKEKNNYSEKQAYNNFTLVDLKKFQTISSKSLFTKCGWSPFNGWKLKGTVEKTAVNKSLAFDQGRITGIKKGKEVSFH